jgi:hypothetical protein
MIGGKVVASLKHKRHEFSVSDLIGSLHVEEKARAKDTRARGCDGSSSAHVVQKITSSPTSPRIRTSLRARESLTGITRPRRLPTSRRRLSIRRRDPTMCVVI